MYVRGAVESLGADCVEKEMRAEHVAQLTGLLERARRRGLRSLGVPPLRIRPDALQLPPGQRRVVLMDWGLRESALYDRRVIHEIQRAAREGVYDIRGFGAKRALPHFDDLVFLGASVSRYPLEGYRERCDTNVTLGGTPRRGAARARDPDHDRGHELRRAVGTGQGGARARRDRGRDEHDDRRRRDDAGGAPPFADARLPAAAVALRDEPRRPAQARTRSRSSSARARSRAAAGCCSATRSPSAWRRCATCRRESTSAAPAAIPTGPVPTTSRSRSGSCARSPTGRSRSS